MEGKLAIKMAGSQKTSGLALWSLILGIISVIVIFISPLALILSTVAIILGIISLVSIKKRGLKGKGMAIAGIILGVVSILIFAVINLFLSAAVGNQLAESEGALDRAAQKLE